MNSTSTRPGARSSAHGDGASPLRKVQYWESCQSAGTSGSAMSTDQTWPRRDASTPASNADVEFPVRVPSSTTWPNGHPRAQWYSSGRWSAMSDGSERRFSYSPYSGSVAAQAAQTPSAVGVGVGIEPFGCVMVSPIWLVAAGDVGVQVPHDHVRAVDDAPGGAAQVPPGVVDV